VDFLLDALIHKASIIIQIQTSGRASIRYGNCVHQISRPDNPPLGPDVQSLYMEITCSGRVTVWTTGHHRPDVAHFRKEFQQNSRTIDRTVVRLNDHDYRPDSAQFLSSQTLI